MVDRVRNRTTFTSYDTQRAARRIVDCIRHAIWVFFERCLHNAPTFVHVFMQCREVPSESNMKRACGVALVLALFILIGCREKPSPTSSTPPSTLTIWDSVGLSGTIVRSFATDGRRFFVGTNNGLYRSLDSGRTWLFTPTINGGKVFVGVMIEGGRVLAGSDSALSISFNDGVSWTPIISPISVLDLTRGTGFLFAATSFGVLRSSNSGTNWTFINNGIPSDLPGFKGLAGANALLFLALSATAYVSTNSGDTWSPAQTAWAPNTLTRVFVNENIIYAATTGAMYNSRTQGASWLPASISIPDTARVTDMAATTSAVYCSTENNGVYSTANGGITWLSFTYNLPDRRVAALASDGRSLYAATVRSGIWRATQ